MCGKLHNIEEQMSGVGLGWGVEAELPKEVLGMFADVFIILLPNMNRK